VRVRLSTVKGPATRTVFFSRMACHREARSPLCRNSCIHLALSLDSRSPQFLMQRLRSRRPSGGSSLANFPVFPGSYRGFIKAQARAILGCLPFIPNDVLSRRCLQSLQRYMRDAFVYKFLSNIFMWCKTTHRFSRRFQPPSIDRRDYPQEDKMNSEPPLSCACLTRAQHVTCRSDPASPPLLGNDCRCSRSAGGSSTRSPGFDDIKCIRSMIFGWSEPRKFC